MVIVDEEFRPLATSAPAPSFLNGVVEKGSLTPAVREVLKTVDAGGGATLLEERVTLRVMPLTGAERVWALLFEEFRARAEDHSD